MSGLTAKGLRRIIMINNGKIHYDNVEMSGVVQITGNNNAGKTTFLDSIQFLFIDRVDDMAFPGHTKSDSMKHYFPKEDSFLIFEVDTVDDGIVVVGFRGNVFAMTSGKNSDSFIPFVYKGEYIASDYTINERDGEKLIFPESRDILDIKNTLSDKNCYLEINSAIGFHELISGQNHKYQSLTLVPCVKNQYRQFKKVFKQIVLSSGETSQEDMKKMILACADSRYSVSSNTRKNNNEVAELDRFFKEIEDEQQSFDIKKELLKELEKLQLYGIKFTSSRNKVNLISERLKDSVEKAISNISEKKDILLKEYNEIGKKGYEARESVPLKTNKRDDIVVSITKLKDKIMEFVKLDDWFQVNSLKIPLVSELILSKEKERFNKELSIQGASSESISSLRSKKTTVEQRIELAKLAFDDFEDLVVHCLCKDYNNEDINRVFSLLDGKFRSVNMSAVTNEKEFLDWFDDLHKSINHETSTFEGKGVTLPLNSHTHEVKDVLDKDALKDSICELEEALKSLEAKLSLASYLSKSKLDLNKINHEIIDLMNIQSKYRSYLDMKDCNSEDNNALENTIKELSIIDEDIHENHKLIESCETRKNQKKNILNEIDLKLSILKKVFQFLSLEKNKDKKLNIDNSDIKALRQVIKKCS